MSVVQKALLITSLVGVVLFTVLLVLRVYFDLTLVYGSLYLLLGLLLIASVIALSLLTLYKKKYRRLFVALTVATAVIMLTCVAIYLWFTFSFWGFDTQRIYFDTVEGQRKVYFEATGVSLMGDYATYRLEEADVKLWVFYSNRETIENSWAP